MPSTKQDTLTIERPPPPVVAPDILAPAPPPAVDWRISLFRGLLFGAVIGALLLGLAAFIIARGVIPVAALGFLGESGALPAVIVGVGAGFAAGGLAGGLAALPRRSNM